MAAPTLTLLNHTELDDADDSTNWFNLTTADTDLKVEGTGSMSGVTRADLDDSYYDHGSAPVTGAGKTLRGWTNTTNMPYMKTLANGGYQLWVYDSSTESNHITMFGSDTYFGGWFYFWQDMDAFTGVTLANVDRWGIEANHNSNAKNVTNHWMDVLRYLDGYSMTGGTSGDKVTLADIEEADRGTTTLYGYGIIQETNGVYFCTGEVQFGTGATTHYFEMDGEVLVFVDPPGNLTVASGLYSLAAVGSGTNVVIKNSVIRGGSLASTKFAFDFDDAGLTGANVSITDNLIVRAAASAFKSGETVTGNTFDDCGVITAAGADFSNCVVKNYEGTADTSAFNWNVNTDPNTYTDGMSFTKGTAATHAIEFGTSIPATITLTNIAFSGYHADDSQNDSTLYFADIAGTITLNLSGCTGNISIKTAGCTVDKVVNPVDLDVHVDDHNGDDLQGARVYVKAADGTGPMPYQDSVTITRSGTTATVAHTGHGMKTNDKVVIKGITDKVEDNNGTHQITLDGVDPTNKYTYTTTDSGSTSYTGTITSTWVALDEDTDVNGDASMSKSYTGNQPVTGWVRKSSASPRYKSFPVSGTIDSTTGLAINVQMISDE